MSREFSRWNGLYAPKKSENKNENRETVNFNDWRIPEEEINLMFGRLTPEERTEFLRLYDKLLGRSVVEEGVNGSEANLSGTARKTDVPAGR